MIDFPIDIVDIKLQGNCVWNYNVAGGTAASWGKSNGGGRLASVHKGIITWKHFLHYILHKMSVMQSFDVFFVFRMNKLNNLWGYLWFEMPITDVAAV